MRRGSLEKVRDGILAANLVVVPTQALPIVRIVNLD